MSHQKQKSSKFQAKMSMAAIAVLRFGTLSEAAQAVQISVSTMKRWAGTPEYARALARAQREIFSETTSALRSAGRDCAETLASIARDQQAPTAARVRAALGVIGLLIRLHQVDAVESRLADIEHALRERGLTR